MVGLWREVGRAEEGAGDEIGGFSRNQSKKHPFSCILVFVFSWLCYGECLDDFKQKLVWWESAFKKDDCGCSVGKWLEGEHSGDKETS